MKLIEAKFTLEHRGREYQVTFQGDEVLVHCGDKTMRYENKPGKWGGRPYKPCETHCAALIRRSPPRPKKPEKRRQEVARTALGIYGTR